MTHVLRQTESAAIEVSERAIETTVPILLSWRETYGSRADILAMVMMRMGQRNDHETRKQKEYYELMKGS